MKSNYFFNFEKKGMVATISTIELFNVLKGKLGESEEKLLTEYVENKIIEEVKKKMFF